MPFSAARPIVTRPPFILKVSPCSSAPGSLPPRTTSLAVKVGAWGFWDSGESIGTVLLTMVPPGGTAPPSSPGDADPRSDTSWGVWVEVSSAVGGWGAGGVARSTAAVWAGGVLAGGGAGGDWVAWVGGVLAGVGAGGDWAVGDVPAGDWGVRLGAWRAGGRLGAFSLALRPKTLDTQDPRPIYPALFRPRRGVGTQC